MNRRRKILLFYLINKQDVRNSGNHPETNFTDRIVGARIALKKKRRKHSPVVKGGGGGGDRSEGTGILVDGAKHPFVLVKSSVQKSNEDESAPEKYSLTSKARRTKDTLFISLPFIASIPSRFTPSPLPQPFPRLSSSSRQSCPAFSSFENHRKRTREHSQDENNIRE